MKSPSRPMTRLMIFCWGFLGDLEGQKKPQEQRGPWTTQTSSWSRHFCLHFHPFFTSSTTFGGKSIRADWQVREPMVFNHTHREDSSLAGLQGRVCVCVCVGPHLLAGFCDNWKNSPIINLVCTHRMETMSPRWT